MMNIDYSVYLVTDQFDFTEQEFLDIIEKAIIGGTSIVQLREKNSTTREFYNLAVKVKQITDKYNVPLIINDRIDVAQAVDSSGVHLGQDDMPCKIARQILGPDKIIGISAENYEDALQAEKDGADYLGIGAIQATSTKEDCGVISKEDLKKVDENITIPRVAIGGVKEYNTPQVINEYGFDGVAIVSAIMKHDNPRESSANFRRLVKDSHRLTITDIKAAIYGGVVADALGVPYEFKSHEEMLDNPATGMTGHGTYNMPVGTWSDDSSLTIALLDSLKNGVDYDDIMNNFQKWYYNGDYTPLGETFDVGRTTKYAIENYSKGIEPIECGGDGKRNNGNGSLMRIMPILLYIYTNNIPVDESMKLIDDISSLTHAHSISKASCNIYNFIVQEILHDRYTKNFKTLIKRGLNESRKYYDIEDKYPCFSKLYSKNFLDNKDTVVSSTGYVVDSLEVALYCCYNTDNYKDAVLKAVNLGGDTDTNGIITGSLAALYYGLDSIPREWLDSTLNLELVNSIIHDFYRTLKN